MDTGVRRMRSHSFKWSFHVNNSMGWRDRVGALLRLLAQRIDGRVSLALRMSSEPPISCADQRRVVMAGLNSMKWLFWREVKDAAAEGPLHEAFPELFGEQPRG